MCQLPTTRWPCTSIWTASEALVTTMWRGKLIVQPHEPDRGFLALFLAPTGATYPHTWHSRHQKAVRRANNAADVCVRARLRTDGATRSPHERLYQNDVSSYHYPPPSPHPSTFDGVVDSRLVVAVFFGEALGLLGARRCIKRAHYRGTRCDALPVGTSLVDNPPAVSAGDSHGYVTVAGAYGGCVPL